VEVSLPRLREILSTSAVSLAQVADPAWKEKSSCAKHVEEADKLTKDGPDDIRADFEECATYWLRDFPALSDKTRSSIVLGFNVLTHPLLTRPLRKLFSTDTNIKPEATFDGKIIIVDLPVQEFRLAGRIANLVWKYCFQVAVLRRMQPADGKSFLRPVFLWADEAQYFVSRFDAEYQATARSAGGCTVYLTQNRESFRRVLGDDDAVDSLLGNLQCKIFCQNSGDTNEWAAKLLGKRWIHVTSTNVGQNQAQDPQSHGGHSSGVTRSEQDRFYVEPATFTTLKRGGEKHNFQIQAIVYNGGHQFPNPAGGSEALLPYKMLTFNQR
jgi:type IV secretory pathway TraG/TraD family ATPase VirD4